MNKIISKFCNSISLISNGAPVRHMSRVKQRFTMPPFWQTKKTRVLYPEDITSRNQEFLDEHVSQQYTPSEKSTSNSLLKEKNYERENWTPGSYRCGLITKKIGVYPMWLQDGKRILSTLLHVCDNHVVRYIPPDELQANDFRYKRRVQSETKKLGALIVGAESADPRLFTKEYFRLFEESGVMPKKRLSKFYITPNARLPPGMPLLAPHFRPGDFIDCTGVTIDRGFQGVMKRWGFKGNRATHGTTKSHRRGGNIGGGGGALDRVWPGTKMPGHMGRMKRTVRGFQVIRVNSKYNVIWVKGQGIPGEIGNYVIIYDTLLPLKRRSDQELKFFPTYFPSDGEELPENLLMDKLHDFNHQSITYEEDKKK